jgi:hypothetical protein
MSELERESMDLDPDSIPGLAFGEFIDRYYSEDKLEDRGADTLQHVDVLQQSACREIVPDPSTACVGATENLQFSLFETEQKRPVLVVIDKRSQTQAMRSFFVDFWSATSAKQCSNPLPGLGRKNLGRELKRLENVRRQLELHKDLLSTHVGLGVAGRKALVMLGLDPTEMKRDSAGLNSFRMVDCCLEQLTHSISGCLGSQRPSRQHGGRYPSQLQRRTLVAKLLASRRDQWEEIPANVEEADSALYGAVRGKGRMIRTVECGYELHNIEEVLKWRKNHELDQRVPPAELLPAKEATLLLLASGIIEAKPEPEDELEDVVDKACNSYVRNDWIQICEDLESGVPLAVLYSYP